MQATQENEITTALDNEYTTRLLAEMIAVPSVVGQEGALAQAIHAELLSQGIDSWLEEVEPGRSNVVARIQGKRPGKRLHLNGHMDTVPVCEGWTKDPFKPLVQDGRMYGLGACDMKAGLACHLNVLRAFQRAGADFAGELSFSAVIDEEAYSKGARAMLESDFSSCDAVIISEPYLGDAGMPVPLGITGKILYDITVKGRAAHGFRPQMGINAVEEAARILTSLDELDMQAHPDFGKGNLCTLKIEGGYEVYSVVVPDRCRFELNRMLVPGETRESALGDMRCLVEHLNLRAEVEVALKPPAYESFVLQREEPILQAFHQVYSEVVGQPPHYTYSTSITDANVFSGEAGIPCLHIGPGRGNVHQPDEYVPLDTLPQTSQIIALTAVRFLSG
jgi:acetylornithine deacetylase/succinyl-diaminopimelate desuccinylase family protein